MSRLAVYWGGRKSSFGIPVRRLLLFHPEMAQEEFEVRLVRSRALGVLGPPRHYFALDVQGVHLFLEPQAESDLVNIVALILPGFRGLPAVVQEDRRRLRRQMVYGRAVLHQLG